ncbi:hypothetical protein [Rothia nasimurium]|uniref:hypothetical protein n=1 Tax=Rothia nasimurium TaxID=85336 RepID=UPI003BA00124
MAFSTPLAPLAPTCALLATCVLLLTGCGNTQTPVVTSPSSETTAASPTASPSPTVSSSPTPDAPVETSPEPEPTPLESVVEAAPSATALTPPVNDGFTIDPATLLTTDIVQGTPVDPAAYSFAMADQPSVVFQTPDPQVACLMQPYGVFCMTDDSKNWVLQSVSLGPTATTPRTVQAQGRAATHDWFKTNTPLQEGQSLSWMGLTCTVTGPVTVQCTNGTTTFNLSDIPDR